MRSLHGRRLAGSGIAALVTALCASMLYGQTKNSAPAKSVLQQHYDAAQSYQSAGNLAEAARQYRIFIADVLGELAIERAHIGDYEKAAPLFDEALVLAPNSPALKIEYAQAAFAHGDLSHARSLAEQVIRNYPANTKACAKARLVLGRVLMKLNKGKEARQQFEAAVALEPDFENGYALAVSCLNMQDKPCAANVFSEMLAAFGDTAVIHRQFGLAYGNSDFQQDAIIELQEAVAKDPRLPGAHYALAAVYLSSSEGAKTAEAEAELWKELDISPSDAQTYAALGHIEQEEHKYAEAERDLKHAVELNAENPDAYFYLGQLYFETSRPADAETELRKSIILTKDPSRNRYQVRQAHYMLGRVLRQAGRTKEADSEMQISVALMVQSLAQDRSRLADYLSDPPDNSRAEAGAGPANISPLRNAATSKSLSQIDASEGELAPVLADSYNNLGAIAASGEDLDSALIYFQRAAEWNPSLEGLDHNWGHAAFSASRFQDAVRPLSRALRAQPEDASLRSMLGISQYMTADYSGALRTLQPVEAQVTAVPQLAFIYAASMVKGGNFQDGLNRLLALEKSYPAIPDIHRELAAAYQQASRPKDAAREKRQYEALLASESGAHAQ